MAETSNAQHVLKSQANWDALYFYQKSDVIYQLAFSFCERFIHLYKDRTRDQVIQAVWAGQPVQALRFRKKVL